MTTSWQSGRVRPSPMRTSTHPGDVTFPVFRASLARCTSGPEGRTRFKRPALPSLRHAVHDASVFMAREAKAYEPLAIEPPRGILQERHPPPVVLDQVVVGGNDRYYATLNLHSPRNWNLDCRQHFCFKPFCAVRSFRGEFANMA